MLRAEILSPAFGLTLLFLIGISLDCTLTSSGRQAYPVVSLEIEDGVDRGYAGKYAQDLVFETRLQEIAPMRELALRRAMQKTGLKLENNDAFVVGFKDKSLQSEFGASSRMVRTEVGDVHLVTVSTDQLMLGVMDIRASLVHEFIHCLMRERMGNRRYRALPAWVREGIAVWGAGQLDERSRNVVANAILNRLDLKSLISRINEMFSQRDPYLMDALTFEWVDRSYGESAVRVLIADIVVGEDPIDAIEGVTGFDWSELVYQRDLFAGRYFEGVLSESGLFEFTRARRYAGAGDLYSGVSIMQTVIDQHPDSLLVPNAWYWVGRWNQELECHRLAAEAFGNLLDGAQSNLGLLDDARLRLADSLGKLGDHEKALDELEIWFQENPDDSWDAQAEARFYLGRTHFMMGNYLMAAASLRIAAQAGRVNADEALYYLALAHLNSGKLFESKLTASELAYRFPRYERLGELKEMIAQTPIVSARTRRLQTRIPN